MRHEMRSMDYNAIPVKAGILKIDWIPDRSWE